MTSEELEELHEIAEALRNASYLDDTELGEWWSGISSIASSVVDFGSEEFQAAYLAEMRKELKRLKEEFVIEETVVMEPITRRELRFREKCE